MRSAKERFESHVDRSNGPDACHPWTGATADGCPMFWTAEQRSVAARRFAWEMAHGVSLPRGETVTTTCFNRLCLNPAHLFLRSDVARRFWTYVRKTSGDSCWEWQGVLAKKSYGAFCPGPGRRMHPAHRYAWQLTHGAPPEHLLVCHKCDNPRCVRPDHLFLGTTQDNSDDKVRKGRQAKGEALARAVKERARQRRLQAST